jgi:ubiquinone/menaquinone biosynthesis C-methylase UbiE
MQSEFWDKHAEKYDDAITRHDFQYLRTIDSTAPLLKESDVLLDLGCASGEICLDLADKVLRIRGIDTSTVMIELARQKARTRKITNVDFSPSDAFDADLAENSFSAITAFSVFHLVDDLPSVLNRLYRLLAPGGLLVSLTPCLLERNWIFRTLVGLAQKSRLAPPIHGLAFDELAPLVIQSGFEIIEDELWDEHDAIRRVVARKPITQGESGEGDDNENVEM